MCSCQLSVVSCQYFHKQTQTYSHTVYSRTGISEIPGYLELAPDALGDGIVAADDAPHEDDNDKDGDAVAGADVDDRTRAAAEDELSTDEDIQQYNGSLVDRDFSATLVSLGVQMEHTVSQTDHSIWILTRAGLPVGRIYELTATTYKAHCQLDHGGPAHATCRCFLTSTNDPGSQFLDLLAWLGNGRPGNASAREHMEQSQVLEFLYSRPVAVHRLALHIHKSLPVSAVYILPSRLGFAYDM